MLKRSILWMTCVWVSLGSAPSVLFGQPAAADEDEIVGTIRRLTTISQQDERRIADWVRAKIDKLISVPEQERPGEFTRFRTIFRDEYRNAANTAQYKTQLVVQTASVASAEFGKSDPDPTVGHVLARALVDMDRAEGIAGLIAGLKSGNPVVRLLCVGGLAAQKTAIAADNQLIQETVNALRDAGLAESQPVVLGRIYRALAYEGQVASVFDAYLALFDKRLTLRRGPAVIADGAELEAYEFFRSGAVLNALNAGQKQQLAGRLGVFLRLDAERYNDPALVAPEDRAVPDMSFNERDVLERMLVAGEAVLSGLTNRAAAIAGELAAGGHGRRAEILAVVYGWVGDPATQERGALNEAPWNVPVGAP
jgi:hypothetical protein